MNEQNQHQNADEKPLIVVDKNETKPEISLFKATIKVFLIILPLTTIGAMSFNPISTITDQLIYAKLGDSSTKNSISGDNNTTTIPCRNNTREEDEVQKAASHFILYMRMGSALAALIFVPVWGAVSDFKGRHIAVIVSSIGCIVKTLPALLVTQFSVVPLWIIILGDTLHGIFGRSTAGLTMVCSAIIGDGIPMGRRTFMMILMDFFFLISETVGQLGSGYAIKSFGYTAVLSTLLVMQIIVLFYGIFVVPKFSKISIDHSVEELSLCTRCKNYITKTFQTFTKSRPNNKRMCILFIAVFTMLENVGMYGRKSVFNIYVQGPPLCWNSVILGIFNGAEAGASGLVSIIIALLFIKAGPSPLFVLAGMLGGLVGTTIYGLSTTTLVMFLGLIAYSPRILVPAVTRSMLSDMVLLTEQGAAMAGYVLLGVVAELMVYTSFNNIYTATVSDCARCFLFIAAAFYVFAIFFLGAFAITKRRNTAANRTTINEDIAS